MLGTIVLLLVIGAVLYVLYINDKLNTNSLSESSGNSGESIRFDDQGSARLQVGSGRTKNLRISHNDGNIISKITVAEQPVTLSSLVETGDKLGANTVYLGVLESTISGASGQDTFTATNVTVRRFKNLFIVFKGVNFQEIDSNSVMVRYEADKMVYALVDATNATVPSLLRDVSYPIVVLTNNTSAQLVLKEWGYTQINDTASLFVKNEKSFRIQ